MGRKWRNVGLSGHMCHNGPVEVIKNLFCGSKKEADSMVSTIQVDTLVPLDSLDGNIWNRGFRGKILYYPIVDFGILPTDVLNGLVSKVLLQLEQEKKVGLFCLGGHGRTGYVASVLLGKLGYEDPIGFLRKNYCERAVESNEQVRHISEVLGKPELAEAYVVSERFDNLLNFMVEPWDDLAFHSALEGPAEKVCGNCDFRRNGMCQVFQVDICEDEIACDCFKNNIYL